MRKWTYQLVLHPGRIRWDEGKSSRKSSLRLLSRALATGFSVGSVLVAAQAWRWRKEDRDRLAEPVQNMEAPQGSERERTGAADSHGLNSSADAGCCA